LHKGSQHTGKSEDPTGLYYFDARYYDPATGRFATRDTVFGDLADPQSLNRYVYCRDNSYKYTYPDGKIPIIEGVLHARSDISCSKSCAELPPWYGPSSHSTSQDRRHSMC